LIGVGALGGSSLEKVLGWIVSSRQEVKNNKAEKNEMNARFFVLFFMVKKFKLFNRSKNVKGQK